MICSNPYIMYSKSIYDKIMSAVSNSVIRILTESEDIPHLHFPKFNINCFKKDYEEWRQANRIDYFKTPRRPNKPKMKYYNTYERPASYKSPVELAMEELDSMGLPNPMTRIKKPSSENYNMEMSQCSLSRYLKHYIRKKEIETTARDFTNLLYSPKLKQLSEIKGLWNAKKYFMIFGDDYNMNDNKLKQLIEDFISDKEFYSKMKDIKEQYPYYFY